jgi:hypothetical protein
MKSIDLALDLGINLVKVGSIALKLLILFLGELCSATRSKPYGACGFCSLDEKEANTSTLH